MFVGCQAAQIETAFIDPGKPWQNGVDESFNVTFRDQHLSLQWFGNRADGQVSIAPVVRRLRLSGNPYEESLQHVDLLAPDGFGKADC